MNVDQIIDAAIAKVPAAIRSLFADDPAAALRASGLTIRAVETLATSRHDGGACDGVSFLEDNVVLYAPTPRSRRANFTLGHEFGHWLIQSNDHLLDIIADLDDPGRFLETVCDGIAQRLLLPEALTRLTPGPVRAADVSALYDRTQASYPVCAIAVAQRLTRLGAVAIINTVTATVTTSSVHPDPDQGWPRVYPWPGQDIPAGHPFATLRPGAALTRRSFWRTSWQEEQEYYIDAVRTGDRIVAVFSDSDLWQAERLHLDQTREFDQRPELHVYCCGQDRTVRGYPCSACRTPTCPACGRCRCQRQEQKEVTCKQCFTRFLPHLVVDGLCVECRS
jgi:Zn-dependent peptidase ImmA (M78 family)